MHICPKTKSMCISCKTKYGEILHCMVQPYIFLMLQFKWMPFMVQYRCTWCNQMDVLHAVI